MDIQIGIAATVEFINKLNWTSDIHQIINKEDICTAECIWKCMNEIYPSWFDDSILPNTFNDEEEALETYIHFLQEYHERRYDETFRLIQNGIKQFLNGDDKTVLLTYDMVILAALQGDDEFAYIDKVLKLSEPSQQYLQKLLLAHPLAENEKDASPSSESYSWSKTLFLNKFKDERPERVSGSLDLLNRSEQEAEIEKLSIQMSELKKKLFSTETEKEALYEKLRGATEKLKESEEQYNSFKDAVEQRKETYLKDSAAQSEEYEKHVQELTAELEGEKKKRWKVEEQLEAKTKEIEEEQEVVRSKNLKVQTLDAQLNKYKSKLEELTVIKEEKKHMELQLKESSQKLTQLEADNKNVSNIRKMLESYKERVADMEMSVSVLTAEKEELQQQTNNLTKRLQETEDALKSKESELDSLQTALSLKELELKEVKESQGLSLGEKLSTLGDEVTLAQHASGSATAVSRAEGDEAYQQLQNEVDDLRRLKERLEKSNATNTSRIAQLELQLEGRESSESNEEMATKLAAVMSEFDKQKVEMKELRQSKDALTAKLMDMVDAQQKAAIPQTQLDELVSRLEDRKSHQSGDPELRAQLEGQVDLLVNTMKEQLLIREKENEYLKSAIKESTTQSQMEIQLVSSVLYTLGMKYHKLRAYCLQLKNENDAITVRLQDRGFELQPGDLAAKSDDEIPDSDSSY